VGRGRLIIRESEGGKARKTIKWSQKKLFSLMEKF
jgi:hypothetical protein